MADDDAEVKAKAFGRQQEARMKAMQHDLELDAPYQSPDVLRSPEERHALCARICENAKRAQLEFVWIKQMKGILAEKKSLLQWKLAANSKDTKLREAELQATQRRVADAIVKIEALQKELDCVKKEHDHLIVKAEIWKEDREHIRKEGQETDDVLAAALAGRYDGAADAASWRRKLEIERSIRLENYREMTRHRNVEMKWDKRIRTLSDADQALLDAILSSEAAGQLHPAKFAQADRLLDPARERHTKLLAQDPDPLGDLPQSAGYLRGFR